MRLQCYNSGCIETRGALPIDRRLTEKFCPHVVKATEAQNLKQFATTETIDVEKLNGKVSDEALENSLKNETADGELTVYLLPNGNIAVPILDTYSSRISEEFVHVRDLQCQLEICSKKSKSKKHTKVVKAVPLCPHYTIGMFCLACDHFRAEYGKV